MAGVRGSGELDKRVTFQSADLATSGKTGGKTQQWWDISTRPTVWAKVEQPPGGDEFDEQGKLQPRTLWKVTIRRRIDITTAHRVVYDGRFLHIKAVGDTSPRAEFLELTCTEYPS